MAATDIDARPSVLTETAHLLRLALPLIGAQMAQMGMGVVDAIMAGRYGATDLAGVALGGGILWPVMLLMMGTVQAVTPSVSQLNGARRVGEIGEVIRQGLWLALGGGLLAVLILNNVAPVYGWLHVDPVVAAVSVQYLGYTSFGLPAVMCFFCLRYLADGMGHTRPALAIAVSALTLKVPLNYLLIYGGFGLPELGGAGCGLAQAIVMWLQLVLIALVVSRPRFRPTGWLARFSAPDWTRIRPLIAIGLPIGATAFAEVGMFSGTTLLLGRYGAETVAAHNIAMNLNGVMFMAPMALGMAATIRVGFRVGAGEATAARTTAAISIAATACVAALGSLAVWLFREQFAALYTTEPQVLGLAATLMLFVVFFLIFDATQATALGALRGYKDTRTPMFIALVSYWGIGLPLECTLGFGWIGAPMGVYGFWTGLAIGVGSAALLLSWRLWKVSGDEKLILKLAAT